MDEKEIKKEMSVREYPDSLEIAAGTPSKGTQVKLKCYFDSSKIDEAQKKVEGLLQIRGYLVQKGIMV